MLKIRPKGGEQKDRPLDGTEEKLPKEKRGKVNFFFPENFRED